MMSALAEMRLSFNVQSSFNNCSWFQERKWGYMESDMYSCLTVTLYVPFRHNRWVCHLHKKAIIHCSVQIQLFWAPAGCSVCNSDSSWRTMRLESEFTYLSSVYSSDDSSTVHKMCHMLHVYIFLLQKAVWFCPGCFCWIFSVGLVLFCSFLNTT